MLKGHILDMYTHFSCDPCDGTKGIHPQPGVGSAHQDHLVFEGLARHQQAANRGLMRLFSETALDNYAPKAAPLGFGI